NTPYLKSNSTNITATTKSLTTSNIYDNVYIKQLEGIINKNPIKKNDLKEIDLINNSIYDILKNLTDNIKTLNTIESKHTLYVAICIIEEKIPKGLKSFLNDSEAKNLCLYLIPNTTNRVCTASNNPFIKNYRNDNKDKYPIIETSTDIIINHNYSNGNPKHLGMGSYGRIRECLRINKDDKKKVISAVKKMKLSHYQDILNAYRECYYSNNLNKVDNSFLPSILSYFPTNTKNEPAKKPLRIIMPKGTPFNSKNRSDEQLVNDMASIAAQLNTMHQKGFVHNDVKLENTLFVDDKLRLIDYGMLFDKNTPEGNYDIPLGGSDYPPEYINKIFSEKEKIDVWAFGSMLASVFLKALTQRHFFMSKDQKYYHGSQDSKYAMFHEYLNHVNTLLNTSNVNEEIKKLIRMCLNRNESARPSMDYVAETLNKLCKNQQVKTNKPKFKQYDNVPNTQQYQHPPHPQPQQYLNIQSKELYELDLKERIICLTDIAKKIQTLKSEITEASYLKRETKCNETIIQKNIWNFGAILAKHIFNVPENIQSNNAVGCFVKDIDELQEVNDISIRYLNKAKKQIRISNMPTDKLDELKSITLNCLSINPNHRQDANKIYTSMKKISCSLQEN
ncbi:MAG: protein kinase domain-containing protein, partial [Candidatus Marinamargulisbacteria bacterium]